MQTQINMGTWRRVNVSAFHLDYSLVQRLLEFEEAVNKLVAWSRGRVVAWSLSMFQVWTSVCSRSACGIRHRTRSRVHLRSSAK